VTWRTEHLADGVTLYCGDCREILPTLGKVDAVVTSPPYWEQRSYKLDSFDWREVVCGALSKCPECQILVNLGMIHKDGEVFSYWDFLIEEMKSKGWRLFSWYVWDKGMGYPGDFGGRLAPAHEWVFHFNKASGKVNKWVPTQERKASGTGTRNYDGTMSGISSPDKCGQKFKIPDSVLRFPPHQSRVGIEINHPAVFPIALPEHLLRSFTEIGDIACDPFMGSGTTGVACVKTGRKFIGIEIEPKYFDIACRRISDALKQPDMFVAPRAPAPKQEAML